MKANIGIRRRLAPLLDNDRNQLELFTALLLSLPGSPVLYYGDEIGMGDNIWLGDRDGVRTPMQWTPDRNARLLPDRPAAALPAADHGPDLRLPGAQRRGPAAQHRLAAALDPADDRDPQAAPGLRHSASTRSCTSSNPSVLAFVRLPDASADGDSDGSDRILCVNNLSRFPQPVELDLRRFSGVTPVECMGGVDVPADRRAALPADAARARLLLVPAARGQGRGRRDARGKPHPGHGRSPARACREPPAMTPGRPEIGLRVFARTSHGEVVNAHDFRGRTGNMAGQPAMVRRQGADRARSGDRRRHRDHPR